MKRILCASALAPLAFGSAALAAPVTADFSVELSLPYCRGSDIRSSEALAEPIAGMPDLDVDDEVVNGNFGGFVELDLDAGGFLTVTGVDDGAVDYQRVLISITNIVFDIPEIIVGVTRLRQGAFQPGFLDVPEPDISFTDDSVSILYDVVNAPGYVVGGDADFLIVDGGSSLFQIVTRPTDDVPPIPLPAGLPLALLGLGALGLIRGRR